VTPRLRDPPVTKVTLPPSHMTFPGISVSPFMGCVISARCLAGEKEKGELLGALGPMTGDIVE
ncbi:MAG: hypothetical protein ABI882_07065, partial [Acidobacteriota bacterium]